MLNFEFPIEAFDEDIFESFQTLHTGLDEICPAYRFASFLSVVSSVMGRRVYKPKSQPLFPTFFQVMIGETDSWKTMAMRAAVRLLYLSDAEVLRMSRINSAEGLAEVLDTSEFEGDVEETKEGVRALIYYDELRALFNKAKQKATANIADDLNTLAMSPVDVSNFTRGSTKTVGMYPAVAFLGCSTFTWFDEVVSAGDVEGGLMNRFLFYLHDPMPDVPNDSSPTDAEITGLALRVSEVRNKYQPFTPFLFDADAAKLFEEKYSEAKSERRDNPGILADAKPAAYLEYGTACSGVRGGR